VILFALAAANSIILIRLLCMPKWRAEREPDPRRRSSTTSWGLTARLVRPLYRTVSKGWHMYPIGILFGLGFDTASQIGLLALSALSSSETLAALVIFPLLFLSAMSLIDTTDGLLMMFAYRWALDDPQRKRFFNIAVTSVSVAAAIIIGSVELLSAIPGIAVLTRLAARLNDNFSPVGALIAFTLLGGWLAAMFAWRWRQSKAAQQAHL
jgi:high-affinity nickel-transport protein